MSETSPAPRKRRGRVALILLGLILAVLIGLGAAAKWAREGYEAPGPLAAERAVVIPRGGTEAIAGALKEGGIIADARHFLIASQLTKGAGPLRVLVRHAFRNTLIPLVTLVGLTLPYLLSGSIVLEQVFSWPGMGRMYFESINARDYPVIMGLTLLFSTVALIGQLLADVLYAVVDPRVSYS